MSSHEARFVRGGSSTGQWSPTRLHTERGAQATEAHRAGRAGVRQQVQVTGVICRWTGGPGLKPGSCSGGLARRRGSPLGLRA